MNSSQENPVKTGINPFWFVVAVLTSALPIPALKKFNETKDPKYIIFASVLFIILIQAYVNLLKDTNMIVIYPFVKITSILLVSIAGIFIFKEILTPKIAIGIVFGLTAVYLLTSG